VNAPGMCGEGKSRVNGPGMCGGEWSGVTDPVCVGGREEWGEWTRYVCWGGIRVGKLDIFMSDCLVVIQIVLQADIFQWLHALKVHLISEYTPDAAEALNELCALL
jgi:hypothetical protein